MAMAMDRREERLKNALDKVKDNYDYVFIDCPPALSWLTVNAFTASDSILVTIAPGYFELDSIVQISKSLEEVVDYYNPELNFAGFLFTMSEGTLNSRTSLQILRQTYTEQVFKTVIPRNTALRDAHLKKMDIFSFKPDSKGAMAYRKLIHELYPHEEKIK